MSAATNDTKISTVLQRELSDMQKTMQMLPEQVLKIHEKLRASRNMKLEVHVVFADAAPNDPSPFANFCIVVLLQVIFTMPFPHARSNVSGWGGGGQ